MCNHVLKILNGREIPFRSIIFWISTPKNPRLVNLKAFQRKPDQYPGDDVFPTPRCPRAFFQLYFPDKRPPKPPNLFNTYLSSPIWLLYIVLNTLRKKMQKIRPRLESVSKKKKVFPFFGYIPGLVKFPKSLGFFNYPTKIKNIFWNIFIWSSTKIIVAYSYSLMGVHIVIGII